MAHLYLKTLYNLYSYESQSFRKVHRMIDLFESIIKAHTVVIIGEYLKHSKLSDAAKGLLSQGLRTPSLGMWQLFSRVMFEELQADGFKWSFADFEAEFKLLDKALNNDKTNVIAFRNGYAHGATPTDEQCNEDINKFDIFLTNLMNSQWLTNTSLIILEGKVWIEGETKMVCVHPFLIYKSESVETSFAFFNDLKNDKVGLLNYPLSKHYREKEFYKEFHDILPLHEWKKINNNEFLQRIDELTETFKGRTLERQKLLQFVLKNQKGYLSIQGNPGIGKSALIAQFFKDLRAQKEAADIHVVEYFIRRGTIQATIEYLFNHLIRRTDELFPQGKEVHAKGKTTWDLQQQLFDKWRLWGDQYTGKKLLFLIDGLDEGTENNLVHYMPRENFYGVILIYGSRPGGHKTIDDLWTQLPTEYHTRMELIGLGHEDIRALIYEVANKYELERESAWIDAIAKRSQGNPLYLKLLCDAIEHGNIKLNDIKSLPVKIDEYYDAILDRYAADSIDGDALLASLFTFAAARDYLSMAHIGLINNFGDATIHRIGSTLKEVIYENPLTEDVLDYQLFHESFREYLVKGKARQVADADERIIDFCNSWRDHEGTWEQKYTLQHYAVHASASLRKSRKVELLSLLYNTDYAKTQKKVLTQFDATTELYRLCILTASELRQFDNQLEAALKLVDLRYEEASDAQQVITLVSFGDIDLALKRIESFGGLDKEGVYRRFMLYMLCLMELTLLETKNKPFRKDAIEKILDHLDEQIPKDESVIRWSIFFPGQIIFLMAREWAGMSLNYSIVFERNNDWEDDWLANLPLSHDKLQFEILLNCARCIRQQIKKIQVLKTLYSEMLKHEINEEAEYVMEEAIECARGLTNMFFKGNALTELASEIATQGKFEESISLMEEAVKCIREISDVSEKYSMLQALSSELYKIGKFEDAFSLIQESLEFALKINDENGKNRALKGISNQMAKNGKTELALKCARSINSNFWKCRALMDISREMAAKGKFEDSIYLIDESLNYVTTIIDVGNKIVVLKDISIEMSVHGKQLESISLMQEALQLARGINDESLKMISLLNITGELVKHRIIAESFNCIREFDSVYRRSGLLIDIAHKLLNHGYIEEGAVAMQEALECARSTSGASQKSRRLKEIYQGLTLLGKTTDSQNLLREALICIQTIEGWEQHRWLKWILGEMTINGMIHDTIYAIQKRLELNRDMSSIEKCKEVLFVSDQMTNRGKLQESESMMQEAVELAESVEDAVRKFFLMGRISKGIAKQGNFNKALEYTRGIKAEGQKSGALRDILQEMVKNGRMEDALEYARNMTTDFRVCNTLSDIAYASIEFGDFDHASIILTEAVEKANGMSYNKVFWRISIGFAKLGKMEQALDCLRGITDEFDKSNAIVDISCELAKQGNVERALDCLRGITDEFDKSSAIVDISCELAKQGNVEQSLECARGICTKADKSTALINISSELWKNGMFERSSAVLKEAYSTAFQITNNIEKNQILSKISVRQAEQGNWDVAEITGMEISRILKRQWCWKEIAYECTEKEGWQKALDRINEFKSNEAQVFFIKGWADGLNRQDADANCVRNSLSYLAHDAESIETLLYKHALNEIFFGNNEKSNLSRLKNSLNIQWALDIAAQFTQNQENKSLYHNLDSWLYKIKDEDDREQIELWSRQVAKGKITEDEFVARIRELND